MLNAEVVFVNTVNHSADLEDAEIGRVADVALYLTELGGDHRTADSLDVGVGGVEQADILLNGNAESLLLVRVSPDVGVNLVQTVTLNEHVLDSVLVVLYNVLADGIKRRTGGVDRKIIVAVNTGDLLDDVGVHGNVLRRSPRGNENVEFVAVEGYLKAEACEGLDDGVVVDLNAGVAVDEALVKAEVNLRILKRGLVGQRRNDLNAAVVLHQQIEETGDCRNGQLGVKTLFVAH